MFQEVYPNAVGVIRCQSRKNTESGDKIHLLRGKPYWEEVWELVPSFVLNLRILSRLWPKDEGLELEAQEGLAEQHDVR
jgi:hypothetical protein